MSHTNLVGLKDGPAPEENSFLTLPKIPPRGSVPILPTYLLSQGARMHKDKAGKEKHRRSPKH